MGILYNSVLDIIKFNFNVIFQEWDPSNFLIDYSGDFTRCTIAENLQRGELHPVPSLRTSEGESISGLTDYEKGSNTYTEAVSTYIEHAMRDWITDFTFSKKVRLSVTCIVKYIQWYLMCKIVVSLVCYLEAVSNCMINEVVFVY